MSQILFQQPEDNNFKEIENYKGYVIYEYKNLLDKMNLTFWYGKEPYEYVSSIETIEKAREMIEREINSAS